MSNNSFSMGIRNIMLEEFSTTVLLILAGLYPIINPPAAAFIMLSIVPHATPEERAELARYITFNSLILLLVSLSMGAYVLSFFGISIPILRVAGGIVIAMAGWSLLQQSPNDDQRSPITTPAKETYGMSLRAKAFYPLTLPVTVGPGAIAVAIAIGTGLPRTGLSMGHMIGIIIAMAILSLSIYICMRFAGHINRLLGTVGTQVAMRLFAFIIFCIGLQIFWLGVSELISSINA